jgi:hypothetical protein
MPQFRIEPVKCRFDKKSADGTSGASCHETSFPAAPDAIKSAEKTFAFGFASISPAGAGR